MNEKEGAPTKAETQGMKYLLRQKLSTAWRNLMISDRRSVFLLCIILLFIPLCLNLIFSLLRNRQRESGTDQIRIRTINSTKDDLSRLIEHFGNNARSADVAGVRGKNAKKAVLCCISKDEEPYIDEWTDFHLGLGFSKIFVYDNTELFELQPWAEKRRGNNGVEVIHYPGGNMQGSAYLDCAKKAYKEKYYWAAFWDVDEFLVLKKHDSVTAFLSKHLTKGGLGVNWLVFPSNPKVLYEPMPVTKRFVYSNPNNAANIHVKSMARLKDVNMTCIPHVHFPCLEHGHVHNTKGGEFEGPFHTGPTDVAVLHHYMKKSLKEYLVRVKRGRADDPSKEDGQNEELYEVMHKQYLQRIDLANTALENALTNMTGFTADQDRYVFDDSAWTLMKKLVPKYALYDILGS